MTLSTDCSLERVVSQCPTNLTGADFYALCADAALNAIKRHIADIESRPQGSKIKHVIYLQQESVQLQVFDGQLL